MKANNIVNLIGNTPLVQINSLAADTGAQLFAKLESMNPGGSVKDRLALAMIADAEEKGLIDSETLIIEPTSGNTGIGLAMVAAAKGYRLIVTMPEGASIERRNLIKAYGGGVVLTPSDEGMKGAIARAKELREENPKSFIPMQFVNPANAAMHYKTTGPEIWSDLAGKADVFIAGVGTGGTISGAGKYLKEQNPDVKVIAVEPEDSPVLSGGEPGSHKIQGIGAGFIPEAYNPDVVDEIITVANKEAFDYARLLSQKEGIFSGISSGAIAYAAIQVARRKSSAGKNIVFIVCDTGERYLSTPLYNFEQNE
jgi:cysteine synthase A